MLAKLESIRREKSGGDVSHSAVGELHRTKECHPFSMERSGSRRPALQSIQRHSTTSGAYRAMSGMIFEEAPGIEAIIEDIGELETVLNAPVEGAEESDSQEHD
jgi:hypothetical protein